MPQHHDGSPAGRAYDAALAITTINRVEQKAGTSELLDSLRAARIKIERITVAIAPGKSYDIEVPAIGGHLVVDPRLTWSGPPDLYERATRVGPTRPGTVVGPDDIASEGTMRRFVGIALPAIARVRDSADGLVRTARDVAVQAVADRMAAQRTAGSALDEIAATLATRAGDPDAAAALLETVTANLATAEERADTARDRKTALAERARDIAHVAEWASHRLRDPLLPSTGSGRWPALERGDFQA